MVDTIDLTYEEEHWLKVFSKNNNFFRSLNYNFKKFRCLTENQYLYLEKEIEKAEDNGYIVLSKLDERIFRELAKEEAEVRMLLKKYSNTGYFDKFEYEFFLNYECAVWRNTDAITRITVTDWAYAPTIFPVGTSLSLYGVI